MKYEMIFGDEGLFFDAQKDCEMSGNGHYKVDCGKLMVWNFSEKYWTESHTNKITIQAMRRIIKEPKSWTWEDKKAGRLPEVGSTFTYKNETLTCHFIDCDGEIWAHDINDRIVTPWLNDCQPIETTEERAKWLRSEWVKHAIYLYMSSPKNDVASMGDVYDAMLSGELAVPKGGE